MTTRQAWGGIVNSATQTTPGSTSAVQVGNYLTAFLCLQGSGSPVTPNGTSWTTTQGNVLTFRTSANQSGNNQVFCYSGSITVGGTESLADNLGALGDTMQSILLVESSSISGIDTGATNSGFVTFTDSGFTQSHTGGSMTPSVTGGDIIALSLSNYSSGTEGFSGYGLGSSPSGGTLTSATVWAQCNLQNLDNASVAAHVAGITTTNYVNVTQIVVALKAATAVWTPFTQTQFFSKRKVLQR